MRLPANPDQFDPEKAEEQSLQNLVDRHQERTEKEIVRTIKVQRRQKSADFAH